MTYQTLLLFGSLLSLTCGQSFAKESPEFAAKVAEAHSLSVIQTRALANILTQTPGITRNIGTENPDAFQGPNNSWHPTTRAQCETRVLRTGLIRQNPEYERICGAKWMAPVLARPDQPLHQARLCIDQFEFPDMPCEFPLVWTPASAAKRLCASMGKRVCNSHEWEGACGGSLDLQNPYRFDLNSLPARRTSYNQNRQMVWAYQWDKALHGIDDPSAVCGTYNPNDPDIMSPMRDDPSRYYNLIGKSAQCHSGPDYQTCGTNTWPSGFKHLCRTQLGVYDMHGNVAEVTNFPTSSAGLAHGSVTDKTERKGSFFVVRKGYPDDCRIRQPYEHFHEFETDQHSYYQEGFRCCKDIE